MKRQKACITINKEDMTQEELIKAVGKVIPAGMYSEEVVQLAFTMFTRGYEYSVEKACNYFRHIKECDFYEDKESQANAVDDFINRFRKAM